MDAPIANGLGAKLWAGFSGPALQDLEALCRSDIATKTERRAAAWYLAEWHHFQTDARTTLSWLEFTNRLDVRWRLDKPNLLLQVLNHLELGNIAEADRLVTDGVERYGYDADLSLLSSNALGARAAASGDVADADEARIEFINRIYAAAKLHPIRKVDPGRTLGLDNISSAARDVARQAGQPKISVIVPAFNAEGTIGHALSGLLEQTWQNIEVIVVDDCSADNTCELVARKSASDPRIKLIRSERNAGPYVARNRGLDHATGEYITVHDSDDWSHSQKLEMQLEALLRSRAIATMSAWVRSTIDLQVNHLWRARHRFTHANHSSLLLHRDAISGLGGWDPVRFHADSEFIQRLLTKHGLRGIHRMTEFPLSFGLMRSDSLTRTGASHINSLTFGARMEYRRAFDRWHVSARRRGDLRLDPAPEAARKFPAPASMLVATPGDRPYKVIFAGDLALASEALGAVRDKILAALDAGLRVGVFHWPRYDLDIDRNIDEGLARLIDEFHVDMIAADQSATTEDLVFFDPAGLRQKIERAAIISYRNLLVADLTGRDAESGAADEPTAAKRNLESLFGTAGEWVSEYSPAWRGGSSKVAVPL